MGHIIKWRRFYPWVRFLGAMAIAWIVVQFPLNFLEGILYDARVKLSPNPPASQLIELVAIDSKTLTALRAEPQLQDQSFLLSQIMSEGPLAVVHLNDPTKWEGLDSDKQAFIQLAKKSKSLVFTTDQIAPVSSYAKLKLPEPFEELSLASAPITRDNITFAGDKVSRRLLVSFEGEETLQVKLAQKINPAILDKRKIKGLFEHDNSQFTFIHFGAQQTYKPWSFIDIRDGRFPKGTFAGKIVFIGSNTEQDSDNFILTPLSRDPLAMSKLEAQAHILNTLIENNGYTKTHEVFDLIFTCFVSYLTVLIVWTLRPLKGIAILFTQAVCVFALSYLAFAALGLWINLTHPLLAIFVSYYFFIPYRLIKENKRSWEFEQKNRLLTQVEELKTNFMSMMSHDLKTPIARIQGMAEAALNESERLADHQKVALKTIIRSSDQLNQFVESILDLSRIEAKTIKLHKTSKDINALIEEVVGKYEFLAQSKNIKIITELEPLFSIRIDGDLMKQVIGNLVENAIKYSSENSTITLSSKEDAGKIKVSVTDQGFGIPSDELDNVFLKFYRSKQVKSSSVKGTGLGLYLAKYFVELHDGDIQVESEINKGSRFTIGLPL